MYTPSSFEVTDDTTIAEFLSQNPFAQLTTFNGSEPVVSHVPLLLDENAGENGQLIGHLARANAQWEHADHTTVLVVFTGPHAYISSSWYETPKLVPTWNYTAVHVYGELRVIDDREQLRTAVEQLVTKMETSQAKPWNMAQAGEDFIEKLLDQIVGFTIDIERFEGKFKLSQNHPPERQQRVIDALFEKNDDDSKGIAKLMHRNLES